MKKRRYKYLAGALLCLAVINIQVPDTVLAGTWQQEENSWWYQEDDGIWPAWQWKEIDNKWYYFDKNLNPYQGVQKVDGVEYFFWSDGQLATYDYDGISTATSNNYLVSYNKNGIVIEKVKIEGNKWIKFNNNWYYYDQDLYPYQGIHTIGDATYYFLSNGQLATSGFEGNITTVREGNKYYAYDYTGKVVEQVDIVGNIILILN